MPADPRFFTLPAICRKTASPPLPHPDRGPRAAPARSGSRPLRGGHAAMTLTARGMGQQPIGHRGTRCAHAREGARRLRAAPTPNTTEREA